jgi:hypothetical protein
MLALHLGEIIIWGLVLSYLGLIPRLREAAYFSATTYTALGNTNRDLGEYWRGLIPVIVISGMFTFAWTTSSLVSIMAAHNSLLDRLEEERERRQELRDLARRENDDNRGNAANGR